MALKSNRNAILTGYVDAFCLACECLITSGDEVEKHMSLKSHTKNLEALQLVEKYKNDDILKVKSGYYCKLCNLLFTTLTKVGLHVDEKDHKTRKGALLLGRIGSWITFGDVVIEEKAWHGLVGDMCAVCNVDFEDERDHQAGSLHSLNLVKNKVEFHEGHFSTHIYRKIDDSTFQCLTCNTVLPLSVLTTHFDDSEHKFLLNSLQYADQIPSEDIKNQTVLTTMPDVNSNNSSSEGFNSAEGSSDESASSDSDFIELVSLETNKSKILECVTIFEKNEVNINFESETALCKKCLGNIDFEFKTIECHIEEHIKNPLKRDVGYVPFPCEADMRIHEKSNVKCQLPAIGPCKGNAKDKTTSHLDKNHNEIASEPTAASEETDNETNEDPAKFAKANELTYNSWNKDAYCRLCSTRVPASLRSMKEHVAGNVHKKRSQSGFPTSSASSSFPTSTTKPSLRKMSTEDYLDEVFTIENYFLGAVKVVNDKFCIDTSSFHMITTNGGMFRCQVCELFINRMEISSHIKSYSHERKFRAVPVLWAIHSEFVREVRTGIFHCGFCNIMEASVEGLQNHFQSREHKNKKDTSVTNLEIYRPAIERHKERIAMEHIAQVMRGFFGRF